MSSKNLKFFQKIANLPKNVSSTLWSNVWKVTSLWDHSVMSKVKVPLVSERVSDKVTYWAVLDSWKAFKRGKLTLKSLPPHSPASPLFVPWRGWHWRSASACQGQEATRWVLGKICQAKSVHLHIMLQDQE